MNEKNTQNVIPNVDSKKKEERNVPDLRFNGNVIWHTVKIGEILKIKSGMDQKKVETIDGKYNIYGTGGIIGKTNTPIYSKESVGIGRKGTIDKPFYFNEPFWTVDTLFYSEIKNHHAKFVYYLFQNINWKLYNQSTSVPSLTSSIIENISVNIPNSVSEEIKIAKFLTLIDERIFTQKKIIEDLNTLIDSIIDRLFFDNDYNVKLSDVITQSTNRNKNELINCVSSVSNKYGFIKQSEQFEDRDVASDDLTNYKVITLNDFGYNPARINVGSIARYKNTNNTVVSPMYICFKCVNNLYPEYLEYYFKSKEFKIHLLRRLEGSVRQCLTFESMQNIPFHLPDLDEQKKNAKIISVFFKKIQLETSILSKLILQKDYLLSKMFI